MARRMWMSVALGLLWIGVVSAQSPYGAELRPTPAVLSPAATAEPAHAPAPAPGVVPGPASGAAVPGYYCGDPCGGCGPRLTARAEFLLWWLRDARVPALVTTGSVDEAGLDAGILGQPGTAVLFGGQDLDHDEFVGGRLTVDYWMDYDQTLGFQVSGFLLEQKSILFGAASDEAGSPVLGIPFIDAQSTAESLERIAFPDAFAGGIGIRATTQLWGFETNALGLLSASCNSRIHWLAGFRYLQLRDSIDITRRSAVLDSGLAAFEGQLLSAGDELTINDNFSARNRFYGVQIGAVGSVDFGRFSVDGVAKIAFGGTRHRIAINGSTGIAGPGLDPAVASGGLLALPTNIGRHSDDEFSVVPELGVSVAYHVRPGIRVFLGYTIIYWSDVARAGDQINRTVNTTQVPSSLNFGAFDGPVQPIHQLRQTDFWAQGINFGVEVRW